MESNPVPSSTLKATEKPLRTYESSNHRGSSIWLKTFFCKMSGEPQDELFDHGNTGRRTSFLQLTANWNTPNVNKKAEELVNKEIEEAYRGYSLNQSSTYQEGVSTAHISVALVFRCLACCRYC
ncbi:hypothetical protein PENANT_c258G10430, partial [Penicillium antarcticum]